LTRYKVFKNMVPPNLPKCRLDSWQDCLGYDYHICIFLTKSVNCFGVMQDINDKLVSSCTWLVFPRLPWTICLWFWWDGTRRGTDYLPNILLHLVKLTTLFLSLVYNKKFPQGFQMILQQKIVAILTTHFSWCFWQHLWKPPTKIWIGFVTVTTMYFYISRIWLTMCFTIESLMNLWQDFWEIPMEVNNRHIFSINLQWNCSMIYCTFFMNVYQHIQEFSTKIWIGYAQIAHIFCTNLWYHCKQLLPHILSWACELVVVLLWNSNGNWIGYETTMPIHFHQISNKTAAQFTIYFASIFVNLFAKSPIRFDINLQQNQ
jgi:hypothetical protein